jgi:hypothetical protein
MSAPRVSIAWLAVELRKKRLTGGTDCLLVKPDLDRIGTVRAP